MSQLEKELRESLDKLTDLYKNQLSVIKALMEPAWTLAQVIGIHEKTVALDTGFEVTKPEKTAIKVGDVVRLNQELTIIGISPQTTSNLMFPVIEVSEHGYAKISTGTGELSLPTNGLKVREGQMVSVDKSLRAIVGMSFFQPTPPLENVQAVTWDQIGGNAEAKSEMREAIEFPYQHKELYKFFNKKPLKGILLKGPSGTGKTMLARAAATSLARIAGSPSKSGFFHIKGPSVLSKWVGEGESKIRSVFAQAKEHKRRTGVGGVIFVDEADAVLPRRGGTVDGENRITYTDSIVDQFLVEMDGFETSDILVLLATNRPDILDPAVVREGRIDRIVEVPRPSLSDAIEILTLGFSNIPLCNDLAMEEACTEITNKIYTEGNALLEKVSGAMLMGVIDRATSFAMRRSIAGDTSVPQGVSKIDIALAVNAA